MTNDLIKKKEPEMAVNPFADDRVVIVGLYDRAENRKVNKELKPISLIPFVRKLNKLYDKYASVITEVANKVERELTDESTIAIMRVQENLDRCADEAEQMKNAHLEAGHDLEVLMADSNSEIAKKYAELGQLITESESTMKGIEHSRISKILNEVVINGGDLMKDLLCIVFDDEISQGVVEGLSIPKIREIMNKIYELNDIEYVLQVPIIQKVRGLMNEKLG